MTIQGRIGISMVPPGPPYTYLGVAFGLISGVRILADSNPVPIVALAMLASHCVECSLKAYLSRDGSDAVLRDPKVRHDLVALWDMARSAGLSVGEPPAWVVTLGAVHGAPYYLRYQTGVHGISVPSAEPMATELEGLLKLIHRSVRGG